MVLFMSPSPLSPQIPQFISALCSVPVVMALSSSLEGFFYSNVNGFSEKTSQRVRWIKENCDAHIHKIQLLFNVVNTSSILYHVYTLIEKGHSPIDRSSYGYMRITLAGLGVLGIVAMSVYLNKKESITKEDGELKITNQESRQQMISKYVLTAKVIWDFVSVLFKENKLAFAFGIVTSAYNLFKNSGLDWLNYSREFPHSYRGFQNRLTVTYQMLRVNSPPGVNVRVDCVYSRGRTGPAQKFCIDHFYHSICLEDYIKTKSEKFNQLEKIKRIETKRYNRQDEYICTDYHYAISIKEEIIPSCIHCNEKTILQNTLEMNYFDSELNKTCDVVITVVDAKPRPESEKPFDRLYAAYNVVQAGLANLQNYPELAGTIYKIQEFMLITDCFGLYLSYQSLLEKIKEKYTINENNRKMFYVAAAVAGVVLTASSYLAVKQLNVFLESSIDLMQVMKNMNVPADFLKDLDVKWNAPWSKYILQTVLINRIAVNIGLVYFSENKGSNLISIFAQCTTLFKISNLRWIELNQIVNYAQVTGLTIQSMFMVDPSCAGNQSYLQASLKVIHSYLSRLLNHGRFEYTYEDTRDDKYGGYDREYFWNAFLNNPTLAPYEPYLHKLIMHVGYTPVRIKMETA